MAAEREIRALRAQLAAATEELVLLRAAVGPSSASSAPSAPSFASSASASSSSSSASAPAPPTPAHPTTTNTTTTDTTTPPHQQPHPLQYADAAAPAAAVLDARAAFFAGVGFPGVGLPVFGPPTLAEAVTGPCPWAPSCSGRLSIAESITDSITASVTDEWVLNRGLTNIIHRSSCQPVSDSWGPTGLTPAYRWRMGANAHKNFCIAYEPSNSKVGMSDCMRISPDGFITFFKPINFGITIPITESGTGSSSFIIVDGNGSHRVASGADLRRELGLALETDVQPWSDALGTIDYPTNSIVFAGSDNKLKGVPALFFPPDKNAVIIGTKKTLPNNAGLVVHDGKDVRISGGAIMLDATRTACPPGG
ncbi:uncharacterized protein EV422DRAFT_599646 [Fimicolochytrium jonesii]|uniref:uncharacterized protein n=1 Tax=Fimicolochytrium jonesii TaxID=1396493 RepID=UPI0022FE3316|nr:uncharacterized protein EV422DRAFT_599646 [Fimicolochytrium jonesii]KAI8819040.1 hypothetical protein EV422DRAFT_599646 [Fimicolochytrium jonesii]